GNFVAVIFDLLIQKWYVLEVVGIQGALIHLTVGQLEVVELYDLNVQAGIFAQLIGNILQDLDVGHRRCPDGQRRVAIIIGLRAFSVVDTTASSQDQSGGGCNTG